MRIGSNTTALNVWTSYSGNLTRMQNAMKKLSTGEIANTDDPAGIGISERMRAEIKSSSMAKNNTDNAVSMLQTADAWLQKIDDQLSRMKELSVEARSGTVSADDVSNIETEYKAMQDEITRITSKYTAAGKYNGIYLFRGGTGIATDTGDGVKSSSGEYEGFDGVSYISMDGTMDGSGNYIVNVRSTLGGPIIATTTLSAGFVTFDSSTNSYSYDNGMGVSFTMSATGSQGLEVQVGAGVNQTVTLSLSNLDITNTATIGTVATYSYNPSTNAVSGSSHTAVSWSSIIDSNSTSVGNANVTGMIDLAISYVANARASVAAQENRLNQTGDGLSTYTDNLSSAESKIRDVDMAQATTEYSREQVLVNAATSMLAQANSLPANTINTLLQG